MPYAFDQALEYLRAAAEPTRLRLLALLARAELTVGELCEIVGQSQPRVSRHLKLLSDAGLIDRFREQHWVYYRAPTAEAEQQVLQQLLALTAPADPQLARDRERMEIVIAERARRAANQLPTQRESTLATELDEILLTEVGAEPVGALLDIGTGQGGVLKVLASRARRAVGVDISADALRVARTNVHKLGLSHCEFQRGDMYHLPFHAPLFDTVTMDRVLASAERPQAALNEAARTLKAEGRLLLLEDFDRLADGGGSNPIARVREWIAAAGLRCERLRPVDTEHGHLIVALARQGVGARVAA
jgi:DNA-binding transcriptional ArsR family regulator